MHVVALTKSVSEERTYRILNLALARHGFSIHSSVALQDVLRSEPADQLDGYNEALFYRQSRFDFVICHQADGHALVPVFAVEFDGTQHETDVVQQRRDELKNRFCKDAEFPLLRITAEQIEAQEKISVLEYMIELYMAWDRDGPGIQQDCLQRLEEWISEEPGPRSHEIEIWGVDADFDPGFIFALEHPYPAIRSIEYRLNRKGIHTGKGKASKKLQAGQEYLCVERLPHAMGADIEHPGRWTSTFVTFLCQEPLIPLKLTLTPELVTSDPPEAIRTILRVEKKAALKWACPTGRFLPLRNYFGEPVKDVLFCDLPGVSIPDVAEGLAEYLCLREIDKWAQNNLDWIRR